MYKTFLKVFAVAGCLYFFLVSIGLMGAAFRGFGEGFAEQLIKSTSDPFVALFIGILATSVIQSSSTTTSIVVGMVASGVLTIGHAVPIIMGANIGTTVTNTMVSFGHITRREEFKRAIAGAAVHDLFNIICVCILFPLELATGFLQRTATSLSDMFVSCGGITFTSPVKIITEPSIHLAEDLFAKVLSFPHDVVYISMLILSVVLLFLSLYYIVRLMKSLVIERTETVLNNVIGSSGFVGILAGIFFTVIVQSSSITTSLLVPLIGAGVLTVRAAFPVTMGANVGTTSTAIMASFATGNPAAITIAFVHLLFNLIGVVFIYPIKIFREIPIWLALRLGDLGFRRRRLAVLYVIIAFFVVPGLLIFINRMIR